MFSKKTMVIAGAVVMIVLNGVVFSFNYIRKSSFQAAAVQTVLFFVSPVQEGIYRVADFSESIWTRYFYLVSTAEENAKLRRQLAHARQQIHACRETELTNQRLEAFVELKSELPLSMQAAQVVAKDPSPWYRTVVINAGRHDAVEKSSPVIVPDGVVGQVTGVSSGYAKVLLILDRNCAVDALVQRTRARGLVRGSSGPTCRFEYALRKEDIRVGDTIITSGLDGIFLKGLRIGRVSKVIRRNSGIFQDIEITPFVDFQKLEEVFVVLNPPSIDGVID